MNCNRLFLVGYRAVGKSASARLLADALQWSWCDSDKQIEQKEARSIAEIFATSGESEFRRLEREVLTELSQRGNAVIATGGGAVLSEENRALMSTTGTTVWLTATAATIRARLLSDPTTSDNRPALHGQDAIAEVELVLRQREPLYESVADFIVSTEDRTPEKVAAEIRRAIG